MNKEVIKSTVIGEQYTRYNHKSGLTILLCPMQGYSSTYALFATRYGSIDTCFKTQHDADFVTVPEGIAHFLEHKMFEDEDGDAFAKYAKTGASANAFTSFDRTAYEFLTSDNVYESLEILLKMVTTPYFTEKSVAKEQGIIGQEIEMYNDDPNWRVFFNLLRALYVNHPLRIDIAGTAASIAQIDKDLLYRCYNTFYNLKNMVLAISGNFDIERVLEVCDKVLKPAEEMIIDRRQPEEPLTVAKEYVEQEFEVSIPLFQFGFKVPPYTDAERLKLSVANDILLEALAGEASPLYSRLYEQGLINDSFSYEGMIERECVANVFSGESKNPQKVCDEIVKALEQIQQNGIDTEAFERAKKFYYGRLVFAYNNVESVASALVTSYLYGRNAYDIIDMLVGITKADVDAAAHRNFNIQHKALSVVKPKT
ncbi:EF-P 5-aminopentanol modification-associated protein YfmH [Acetanaerobacterium elongatum]|uniref:Predicted Zn-dependent peptidase n=1 Tax=Acetanaerobacterium elongatum TaxID=258515 RepID=A0A1H0B482_9FIRM|nr:pitrilysin family protein [Acetanaerobacterium elongatum]SDN40385.1 Predicted Zn-dependent peptidase [Acetanaerobacterium elongatum]